MYKPKRLHPIALLLKLGMNLKKSIIPFAAVIISGLRDNKWIVIILVAGIILFNFLTALVSWLRHTYQLTEKELRIEHGVFIRKKRYIPYERIQSVDISQGVLQRIFGLVMVQIETAGRNHFEGAEAVLSALSQKEAQCIQEFYVGTKELHSSAHEEIAGNESKPCYRITAPQLFLLSVTSGSVGVIISAVIAILSHFDNVIPYKKLFGDAEKAAAGSILLTVILVFTALSILWMIAFIRMLLKYADFTINKTENDLIITQGLLTRRQLTIPLNRIQSVHVSENIIRQLFGFATVYVESAGGSIGNRDAARVMIIPIIKREQIPEAIKPFLLDYQIVSSFNPLPKRALRRYVFRSWYVVIPLMIAAFLFLKIWGLLSLVLFAAAALWAFLKHKDAGWNIKNDQLSIRYRTINRTTVFMKRNRIQSLKISETYFQHKKKLATIEAFVKSGIGIGGGRVADLSIDDVNQIYHWFERKKDDLEA